MTAWIVRYDSADSEAWALKERRASTSAFGQVGDLTDATTKDAVREAVNAAFPTEPHGRQYTIAETLWMLRNEVRFGDPILMPTSAGRLHLGFCASNYEYDGNQHGHGRHTVRVHWENDIAREHLQWDLADLFDGRPVLYRILDISQTRLQTLMSADNDPAYHVVLLDPADDLQPWLGEHITVHSQADAMWRAGFSSGEADDWYRVGRWLLRTEENLEPADADVARIAQVWKVAGFTPTEAREWRGTITEHEDEFDVPLTAQKWRAAGFTLDSASRWIKPGSVFSDETVEFAAAFARKGWYVSETSLLGLFAMRLDVPDLDAYKRAWLELDIDSPTALAFIKAGVPPDEARILNQLRDREHLDAELREREAELPPLDPSFATWINHIIYVMCGETEEDDLPFALQHVRDGHDIENEQRVQEELEELFGAPNKDGVYLGKVVEFSADSNEDGWLYADMMVDAAAKDIARLLHFVSDEALIEKPNAGSAIVTLPDGTRVATYQTTSEGVPSWHRETREPTATEKERWAAGPRPVNSQSQPPT